jgi:uncharacterized protein (DUF2336 family)
VSASALIREVEDKVASAAVGDRVAMLSKIVDLLRAQVVTLPKVHLDVFDAVIQRLAAEIEIAARVELAEQLAPLANAPIGIVRQLAHDQAPVAKPLIASSAKLMSEDLISIAVSRGQQHMRAIADRQSLVSDVTDVLVLRGDTDVVSAVASNSSARFSELGFQTLLHRAREDEAIRASIAQRAEMLHLDINTMLNTDAFQAEDKKKSDQAIVRDRLNAAMEEGIEQVLKQADAARETADQDEEEVEKLIAEGALDDGALARFATDKRHRAIVFALAHLGKMDEPGAAKMMSMVDPKMLIFLLRSQNFSWATTRAVITARKLPLPNMHELRRYMDVFNQTTPDVAKKVYAVRSAK